MMGAEFASCLLKLGRAEEHLDTFKTEFQKWSDSEPYVITKKCNSDGSHHGLVIDIMNPPPQDRWSLIAGDCIHNLRSALDTVVYAVAVRESGVSPPPNADKLQFPITDCPEAFEVQRKRRIASLSVKTQAWIERAQPYNRPHKTNPPLLRILSEFSNSDKHRTLNVALQHASHGRFKFLSPLMGSVPTLHYLRTPIHSGPEFVFFTLDPPKRDVNYKYDGAIAISVTHSPGPSGNTVSGLQDLLECLIAEVRRIINGAVLVW